MILQKRFIGGLTLFIAAAFAAAALLVFIWRAEPVKAIRDREQNFGTVSLNAGQTIRFNVVNPHNSPRRERLRLAFDIYSLGGPDTLACSPDGAGEAVAACTNNLRFVRREFCEATLSPGEAVSLNFTSPAEMQINAVLIQEPDNSVLQTAATLEIREAGRTVFVHPGTARGFNPQPDPPDRRTQ